MENLQYPVGKFERLTGPLGDAQRRDMIRDIELAPTYLRRAVDGLDDIQLATPYRQGGWTVRQVVHHVPDSHLNGYTRMKLALTEDNPTIKPYHEAKWAELPDARTAPIGASLAMLESLHERWVTLLRSLYADDYARQLMHPDNGPMTVDGVLATYSWHSRHHVAHITSLRKRMGW